MKRPRNFWQRSRTKAVRLDILPSYFLRRKRVRQGIWIKGNVCAAR